MKVLHIYKTYYPDSIGGVERSIKNIINGTRAYGLHSNVLSTYKKKASRYISFRQNFEISSMPVSLSLIFNFKKIIKEFDILHYHYPWPFMDFLHLLLNIKKPSLITYHSDIVRQKRLKILYNPLRTLFFSKVNKIVCSSKNYLNSSKDLQKFKNKTTVIPFGIKKSDYFIEKKKLKIFKTKYGSNFVIFIGVLRYYKGLNYLIDAIAQTNHKLLIVGNGKIYDEIQTYIKKKSNNIKILRNISDSQLPYLIKLSKCLVLPSHLRSEAFGFSLLEGLMFGKPLISCDIKTGTSFININNLTGYVVKPKSSIKIKNALNKIFTNCSERNKFEKNSIRRFNQYFTQKKMAKSYVKLYRSILNKSDRSY